MAYKKHVRMTMSGTLGPVSTPFEIFSYSFALGDLAQPDDTAMPSDSIFDDLVDGISAFHNDSRTKINTNAHLTLIKAALIGPGGEYLEEPKEAAVTIDGGAGGAFLPPQCSLAVSLAGPEGLHRIRGRFYLPLPSVTISDTSALISSTVADDILASAVDLYDLIDTAWSSHSIVIASQKGMLGTNAQVRQIRVGRVVDTIRSRRNAIPESYAAADVGA